MPDNKLSQQELIKKIKKERRQRMIELDPKNLLLRKLASRIIKEFPKDVQWRLDLGNTKIGFAELTFDPTHWLSHILHRLFHLRLTTLVSGEDAVSVKDDYSSDEWLLNWYCIGRDEYIRKINGVFSSSLKIALQETLLELEKEMKAPDFDNNQKQLVRDTVSNQKTRLHIKPGPKPVLNRIERAQLDVRFNKLFDDYKRAKADYDTHVKAYLKSKGAPKKWRQAWRKVAEVSYQDLQLDLLERFVDLEWGRMNSTPRRLAFEHLAHDCGHGVEYMKKLVKLARKAKRSE